MLDKGAALLEHKTTSTSPDTNNGTQFKTISGSFKAINGTISNHDLVITSDTLSATGEGLVNLKDQTINYNLNVKYQRERVWRNG